uniref:Uncharacterized protein n=1 Tax=Plectus sambesii TaxID=2011161 RepID=A0A914WAT2_9BILA
MLYFPNFKEAPHAMFYNLGLKYGSPYTFWYCCEPTIIMNTREHVKLVNNGEGATNWIGRRHSLLLEGIGQSKGLSLTPYGPFYTQQRKLVHQALRKHLSDELMERQCEGVLDALADELAYKRFKPSSFTFNLLLDVMCGLIYFHRTPTLTSEQRNMVYRCFSTVYNPFQLRCWIDYFPILRSLPFSVQQKIGYLSVKEDWDGFEKNAFTICNELIDEHKRNMEENGGFETDFLDGLITAYEKEVKSGNTLFEEKQLKNLIFSMINASFTPHDQMDALFFHLALLPDVQEKCFQEIQMVIGDARPTLDKKSKMSYLEACTYEAMRIHQPPSLIFKTYVNQRDTKIESYNVPAGSIVQLNSMVNHIPDENFPGSDPHIFRPERFLTAEGNFTNCKDEFWPFGMNRRDCVGKDQAKTCIFLLVTGLLQKYRFTLEPKENVPENIESVKELFNLLESGVMIVPIPRVGV